MRKFSSSRAGFTLIEMAAVLVLTALALVFAAMLLVTSTEIFLSSRDAAEDSQKIQVAMNRLVKELTWARAGTVATPDGRTVQWMTYHAERIAAGAQVAVWDGTPGSDLLLQGTPLLDNVGAFVVSSTADTVDITLRSTRSPGVTHRTIVHPRYEQ